MIRTATFFAALAINLSTVPAHASECVAPNEIAASLKRWAAIRHRLVFGRAKVLIEKCQKLIERALDTYRPELHYMRGPGPNWHAKHDGVVETRAV
jgi:hypothetical protein